MIDMVEEQKRQAKIEDKIKKEIWEYRITHEDFDDQKEPHIDVEDVNIFALCTHALDENFNNLADELKVSTRQVRRCWLKMEEEIDLLRLTRLFQTAIKSCLICDEDNYYQFLPEDIRARLHILMADAEKTCEKHYSWEIEEVKNG